MMLRCRGAQGRRLSVKGLCRFLLNERWEERGGAYMHLCDLCSICDEFLSQHFCYFIAQKNSLFNGGKKL